MAKRYGITKVPVDSRQHRLLVRRRFRTGVSLTGRQARSLASRLAQDVALPLPYHVLFLSICHIFVLIYSGTLQIPTSEWHIWGLLHVFLMHLILEYSEEGSTQTLYCHGMEHVFQLPRLPMGCTDEARERDLRLGKRFAHLTSTVADKSIEETLGHEMYVKFLAVPVALRSICGTPRGGGWFWSSVWSVPPPCGGQCSSDCSQKFWTTIRSGATCMLAPSRYI